MFNGYSFLYEQTRGNRLLMGHKREDWREIIVDLLNVFCYNNVERKPKGETK